MFCSALRTMPLFQRERTVVLGKVVPLNAGNLNNYCVQCSSILDSLLSKNATTHILQCIVECRIDFA